MACHKPMHGTTKAKGCSHLRLGSFCKLFPKASTWADDFGITDPCEAEEVAEILGGPSGIMHDADGHSPDSDLPAAYTFLAQFIDHDITLDTTSDLHGGEREVEKLANLRSPSLDLDCVYGFGPDVEPALYDSTQPGRLLVGNRVNDDDLPRNSDGTALIGDPRNDENIFIAQLQLLFLRFHNRRVLGRTFEEAQKQCRYHYQWLVLHDFLERICDPEIYQFAEPLIEQADPKKYPKFDIRDDCHRLCMPVEFSVATYRFGHSLVRSEYPANVEYPVIEIFDDRFGTSGFAAVPRKLTVDWATQLDLGPHDDFARSKAFDHLLSDEMIRLPDPIVGRSATPNDRSLAFRNLLRAYVLQLPSGQAAAQALAKAGYPLKPAQQNLKFGEIPGWHCVPEKLRKKLEKHTPLFFYVLREAGTHGEGKRLGKVGSAILLEVFGAMLVHCGTSYLHEKGGWTPTLGNNGSFTLADLVRYAEGR